MHAENRSTIIIPHFRFDLQCGKTKQKSRESDLFDKTKYDIIQVMNFS